MLKCRVVLDVEVIEDPATAVVALDPMRARLLAELAEPASAAALSERVGLTRQKINYHLRALEARGLLAVAEERRWGGLTERLLVATAASYVISPAALGAAAADPARTADRLSARYLIAVGARIVREVGRLARSGEVATLSVDAELRIRPEGRAAFAEDLARLMTDLASRHHDEGGEPHRLLAASHPIPEEDG